MADNAELDRWFDGLNEQERADAIRSADAGQLSAGVEQSLARAGLLTPGERPDQSFRGDVVTYLKMRH